MLYDLEPSADNRYRMNQRAQIPVFNFAGYVTADGDWYDLWAENNYREWIERYQTVQYYALFDRKRKGRYFVGERGPLLSAPEKAMVKA